MNSVRYISQGRRLNNHVVGFSISFDPKDGGPRGIGAEHLREALLQMTRPILRAGAGVAYGGKLEPLDPPEINFTLDLLNLIREEQEETSLDDDDPPAWHAHGRKKKEPVEEPSSVEPQVNKLYNHQAWPNYLKIDRKKEAEWINCCQIVRITQEMAQIAEPLPDEEKEGDELRRYVHRAVCLSAMRTSMALGCVQNIAGAPGASKTIPPVNVRIVLGGVLNEFTGIMPGIFEEILAARRVLPNCPLFILGGFGGAAGAIAQVLLNGWSPSAHLFTPAHYATAPENPKKPGFTDLLKYWDTTKPAPATYSPATGFADLEKLLAPFAGKPCDFLKNQLSDEDNRSLLCTVDPMEAVRLVLRGLTKLSNLSTS